MQKKNQYKAPGYLNAIIVIVILPGAFYTTDQLATQKEGKIFLKYRNIKDDDFHKWKFARFAMQFPGAWYINFYDRITRAYKERMYLTEKRPG